MPLALDDFDSNWSPVSFKFEGESCPLHHTLVNMFDEDCMVLHLGMLAHCPEQAKATIKSA